MSRISATTFAPLTPCTLPLASLKSSARSGSSLGSVAVGRFLLRGLRGDERSVVELSLQGFTAQEISGTLGRAERSVRRLRERVRKQLEELRSQGS